METGSLGLVFVKSRDGRHVEAGPRSEAARFPPREIPRGAEPFRICERSVNDGHPFLPHDAHRLVIVAPPKRSEPKFEKSPRTEPLPSTIRVLIVEDDSDIRASLVGILELDGHSVDLQFGIHPNRFHGG